MKAITATILAAAFITGGCQQLADNDTYKNNLCLNFIDDANASIGIGTEYDYHEFRNSDGEVIKELFTAHYPQNTYKVAQLVDVNSGDCWLSEFNYGRE